MLTFASKVVAAVSVKARKVGLLIMKMILLGTPGSGKGSQAQNLSAALGIPQISTGDLFRKHIKDGTELGTMVKDILDSGGLVPDELTISIVEERLSNQDTKAGYILDGFPRTIPQAVQLDEMLADRNMKLDLVINLDCSDEIIVARMSGRRVCRCGKVYHLVSNPPKVHGLCDLDGQELIVREDDKEETVRSRLKTYYERTEPLIAYYKQQGILYSTDGSLPIKDTTEALLGLASDLKKRSGNSTV